MRACLGGGSQAVPSTLQSGPYAGRPKLNRRPLPLFTGLAMFATISVVATYRTVPLGQPSAGPVDALLVLGSPADLDGTTTETQQGRVHEAVQQFRAGRARYVLFSGGPAANRFVEADVMAAYAVHLGLPPEVILKERTSTTTLENIRDSEPILRAHRCNRVEVISSPEHLPRAALFLQRTPLQWQVHAAPEPDRSRLATAVAYTEEAVGTAALRWFGPAAEPVLHAAATVVHGIAFCVRWVFYKVRAFVQQNSPHRSQP